MNHDKHDMMNTRQSYTTALGMLTFTIGITLVVFSNYSYRAHPLSADLQSVFESLTQKNKNLVHFNLEDLSHSLPASDLTHPESLVPDLSELSKSDLNLIRESRTCEKIRPNLAKNSRVKKTLQFEKSKCDPNNPLPANFWEYPPYMSLNGESFAYLSGPEGTSHLNRLHLLEILNSNRIAMGGLGLSALELKQLQSGSDVVLGNRYVIKPNPRSVQDSDFIAFLREPFEDELKSTDHVIGPQLEQDGCAAVSFESCFEPKTRFSMFHFVMGSIFVFFGTALVLWQIYQGQAKIREQKRLQEEERFFYLRILAHELRTPIASLSLWLELLEKQAESLPEKTREPIHAIREQIKKMSNLAEKTSIFTKVIENDFSLHLTLQILPLREWLKELISEYSERGITVTVPSALIFIKTDPYWLRLILDNLLQNATDHGKAPIQIFVREMQNEVEIEIQDHGTIEFESEGQGKIPKKRAESNGLGIGLQLVSELCKRLHIQIRFEAHPTRAILKIRREK